MVRYIYANTTSSVLTIFFNSSRNILNIISISTRITQPAILYSNSFTDTRN